MSVIGNGDIAKVISDKDGFTFFASGCSNRKVISAEEKQREKNLIWNCSKFGMFVYISTLSVYYSKSEYTQHKREMEDFIRYRFPDYCIVRIGNIDWGTNPNTLINSLRNQIKRNDRPRIENVYRYIIDKDEFVHWLGMIPSSGKHEMNITGKRMKVKEIVNAIRTGKI